MKESTQCHWLRNRPRCLARPQDRRPDLYGPLSPYAIYLCNATKSHTNERNPPDTYAVAALWSNIELFLGLTAANLALSRQVYQYFFPSSHQHSHPGSYFPRYGYGSSDPRSNYRFSRKLRDPTGGELSFAAQDTYVESSNVRPSLSKSDGSEIPLEPGIRKKTEFWISEGDGDVAGQGQAGPTVEGPGIAR